MSLVVTVFNLCELVIHSCNGFVRVVEIEFLVVLVLLDFIEKIIEFLLDLRVVAHF